MFESAFLVDENDEIAKCVSTMVSKHGLVPAGPVGPGAMLESLLCTSVQGIFNIRYTPKLYTPTLFIGFIKLI